jgi:hypothetical protein
MDMNSRKILILIGLALAGGLLLTIVAVFAAPPEGPPPHHGMFHMMGLSGISGDQQNLYVLAGGKIMQYSLVDLKLLKTVDLPKPVPPSSLPPKGKEESGMFPPPPPFPMAGPHGLWAGDGALYVLAGPVIHRYSTPDLTFKTTVELPKPEPPKTGN